MSPVTTKLEPTTKSAFLPAPELSVGAACDAAACVFGQASTSEPLLPEAQRRWAARPLVERLQPVRLARHWIAAHPEAFAKQIDPSLARSEADTLVAEVLPLLEAMRFLERNARRILEPKKLGSKGRPVLLTGVHAEIHHDPLGHVLVIGPANFPLFLPGAQAIQALVAGNAVTWKPGSGGQRVAALLAHVLREAGLPRGVLEVTDDTVEASEAALARHPDKVVFTGSFATGTQILAALAGSATPATMELSGADALVVLPSADLALAAKAVAFGLRLNGAEVCMSPRRLVATAETMRRLRPMLQAELAAVPPVRLKPRSAETLHDALRDACDQGAELVGEFAPAAQRPVLVEGVTRRMRIAETDVFAPVLSLMEAPSVLHLADLVNDNPYALAAAIFGSVTEAQALADQLRVGTVFINDLIAPTADPRLPFGGRGHSGFGVTRGAEGLLEMTATRTVAFRRKGSTRHYEPLTHRDVPLFAGLLGALHGGSLRERWAAGRKFVAAARARGR